MKKYDVGVQLDQLRSEITPRRDLWTSIATRISGGPEATRRRARNSAPARFPRRRRRLVPILAAGVALLVAVPLWLIVRPIDPSQASAMRTVRNATREYSEARDALIESIGMLSDVYGSDAFAEILSHVRQTDELIESTIASIDRTESNEPSVDLIVLLNSQIEVIDSTRVLISQLAKGR